MVSCVWRDEVTARTDGFAAEDLAKYDVLIVEMWRGGACDEELRTVCIWACVGLRAVR